MRSLAKQVSAGQVRQFEDESLSKKRLLIKAAHLALIGCCLTSTHRREIRFYREKAMFIEK